MRIYNRIGEITDPAWYAQETARREAASRSRSAQDIHPFSAFLGYTLGVVICGVLAALISPWLLIVAVFFAFAAVVMLFDVALRLVKAGANAIKRSFKWCREEFEHRRDDHRRAPIISQLEELGVEQVRMLIGTGRLPTEWNPTIADWLKGQRNKGEKRSANNTMHVTRIATLWFTAGAVLLASYPAVADTSCPPGSTIYIDPRLVPQRPIVTREQFIAFAIGSDRTTAEEKSRFDKMYYEQNQPIQIPFKDSIVLIHPHNPCIQQYLGR